MSEPERQLAEHLQRAAELLRGDKLDAAQQEISNALALRPDDLRARNLKGLYLFRATKYEEARTVFLGLCKAHPDDAALRLNLGLVELRMSKWVEAVATLERVLATEPDNARARGYLGLALMRVGQLKQAKEAFEGAGQTELARQVEAQIHARDGEAAHARAELREAAGAGEQALEKREQPFASVELETPLEEAARPGQDAAWQIRQAGARAPLPGENLGARPLGLSPAEGVAGFATARLLREATAEEPFLLAEGGMLVVRVDGRLPTRTFGTIASTGTINFEPLMRRVRAQSTDDPFGQGAEAMFVAVGHGRMVVASRGAYFTLLQLADDIVYARENGVYAFEENLAWESGRVPGGGADALRVVQYRGTGRVVLRSERPLYTLKIDPEAPLYVEHTTLFGWIGRVVPRQLSGDGGAPLPYVECSGEGVLIVEEPPKL